MDDCGDEIKKTANQTVFCARRNAKEGTNKIIATTKIRNNYGAIQSF